MSKLREIRVGIIGAGLIGRIHAQAYRILKTLEHCPADIRLTVVADVNEPLAQEVANQFGFERATTSWEAVADAHDVDAVVVALPNYMHKSAVEALLTSGKHVCCEKPLTINVADSWAMLQAARRSHVVHCMGFNYRRIPAIATIKRALDKGNIGQPHQFIGHFFTDYACDKNIPLSWRFKRELAGGGALVDLGSHIIDIARLLLSDIESVQCSLMTTFVNERPIPKGYLLSQNKEIVSENFGLVDTDDIASFVLRFRNGAVGAITLNRMATGFPLSFGFNLIGSNGAAKFNSEHISEFEYFCTSALNGEDIDKRGFRSVTIGQAHPYFGDVFVCSTTGSGYNFSETWVGQACDFIGAVVQGTPLTTGSFEDGHAVDLVTEAVRLSAERGAFIRIDDIRIPGK